MTLPQDKFLLLEIFLNLNYDVQLLEINKVCKRWNKVVRQQQTIRFMNISISEIIISKLDVYIQKLQYLTLRNLQVLTCYGYDYLTTIPSTLVNLRELNCSSCEKLTTIPNTLTNLRKLYCFNCFQLKEIPDTLINLQELDCYHCNQLTEIPRILINLQELNCSYCTKLTTIPDTLMNLQKLNCDQLTEIPPNIFTNLQELTGYGRVNSFR